MMCCVALALVCSGALAFVSARRGLTVESHCFLSDPDDFFLYLQIIVLIMQLRGSSLDLSSLNLMMIDFVLVIIFLFVLD